ncbi:MAG: Cof-type HAD-IIB family hydrolase [Anaerolineae bacterium]
MSASSRVSPSSHTKPSPRTIRLLAMDLDGTLMDDDMVLKSERVRQAIAAAQERGVVATLATGRMFDFLLPFAHDLGITAPLICYQGGLIQAPDAKEPIYRATMEPALVRQVLALKARRGWHFVLYADDDVFLDERRYSDQFYRDMLGERLVWVDNLSAVLEQHEPVKFLVFVEPEEAENVLAELRQQFTGQMELTRSHARIVEGNPLGVSKGDALRRLAEHLGIPQAEVMAIGDQENDMPMITWAGFSVAMGNGSPVVKAAADWVAPPVTEDGAAVAIERFILGTQAGR